VSYLQGANSNPGGIEKDQKFKDSWSSTSISIQKEAVRRFGARLQSTLIIFKGGKEMARSVGDTNRDSIAALLGKAI
jgi:hypothetical protein